MKLDMKLVKDILEKIEDSNDSYEHSISLFDEFGTNFKMNSKKYIYTIKTLENAGFITKCIPENFDYALGQLTWEGHKLLKKLRKKESHPNFSDGIYRFLYVFARFIVASNASFHA